MPDDEDSIGSWLGVFLLAAILSGAFFAWPVVLYWIAWRMVR